MEAPHKRSRNDFDLNTFIDFISCLHLATFKCKAAIFKTIHYFHCFLQPFTHPNGASDKILLQLAEIFVFESVNARMHAQTDDGSTTVQ